MSRKRTAYSTEFKTKLVLEVLREEKTLNEIASKNNINPKKPVKLEETIFGKCRCWLLRLFSNKLKCNPFKPVLFRV